MNHTEFTGGWTALIWAAKQGHLLTVEILVAYGADPDLTDFSGLRAIDYVRENGHMQVTRALTSNPHSSAEQ